MSDAAPASVKTSGLSVVATAVIWFQVAGRFEARRIDAQSEARAQVTSRPASLRIDSERLMGVVQALADPRFEGRAAGSPGGIAARAFERAFQLADFVLVKNASLENGLLHVDLVREIPEAKKPRSIPISTGAAPQVVDGRSEKAAA